MTYCCGILVRVSANITRPSRTRMPQQ